MNDKLVIIIVKICGDSLCTNNAGNNYILLLCTINQCFVNKILDYQVFRNPITTYMDDWYPWACTLNPILVTFMWDIQELVIIGPINTVKLELFYPIRACPFWISRVLDWTGFSAFGLNNYPTAILWTIFYSFVQHTQGSLFNGSVGKLVVAHI